MPGKSVGVSRVTVSAVTVFGFFLAHIAPRIFLLLCSKTHG